MAGFLVPPAQWEVPFLWVDGGAALMLLLLAAVDEGLAAGFLAADGNALRHGRRPMDEVVHRQRW